MPRKHGARAAGEARKKLSKTLGVPHGNVAQSRVRKKVPTRPTVIPLTAGLKVRAKSFEQPKDTLKRLKSSGKRSKVKRTKGSSTWKW